MDPIPWRPLRLSIDLERRIEQVFAELIDEPWGRLSAEKAWQPEIDLYETDDAYLIEADLPGVRPEDVTIEVQGQSVTISGQRRFESVTQSAHGVRLERKHGRFLRRFTLEQAIDSDRVTVERKEGTYCIHLPKKQKKQS